MGIENFLSTPNALSDIISMCCKSFNIDISDMPPISFAFKYTGETIEAHYIKIINEELPSVWGILSKKSMEDIQGSHGFCVTFIIENPKRNDNVEILAFVYDEFNDNCYIHFFDKNFNLIDTQFNFDGVMWLSNDYSKSSDELMSLLNNEDLQNSKELRDLWIEEESKLIDSNGKIKSGIFTMGEKLEI